MPAKRRTTDNDMRFGEGLRLAREQRGIALDDISVATRVSLRNLNALEGERFRELPGGIFNRGIVRSYARYIGLDEDEAVSAYTDALRFHGISPDQENENWAEFAENVKRSRPPLLESRRVRWAGVFLMLLFLAGLASGVTVLLVRRGIVHLPPPWEQRLHLRHTTPVPNEPQPDPA